MSWPYYTHASEQGKEKKSGKQKYSQKTIKTSHVSKVQHGGQEIRNKF